MAPPTQVGVVKLPITYTLPCGSGVCPVRSTTNVMVDGAGVGGQAVVMPKHGVANVLSLITTNSLFEDVVVNELSQLVTPLR